VKRSPKKRACRSQSSTTKLAPVRAKTATAVTSGPEKLARRQRSARHRAGGARALESREKAARVILPGVIVDGQRVDKAGALGDARRAHRAGGAPALVSRRRQAGRTALATFMIIPGGAWPSTWALPRRVHPLLLEQGA